MTWYYVDTVSEPVELYTYEDACDVLRNLDDPQYTLHEFHSFEITKPQKGALRDRRLKIY